MKTRLTPLYNFLGWLAALFLLVTLVIIVLNILGRKYGFYLRGADAYAGYCIAAVAFLSLAATLSRGEHIRVTLLLQRLTGRPRKILELWCLSAAALLAGYFTFFAWKMVWFSYVFHDISQGHDATPLWIPQSLMALGVSALLLAFVEQLILRLRGQESGEEKKEELVFTE